MNRRGFVAAMLAAPLALLGSFAGNHNKEGWVEMIASQPSKVKVTELWMRSKSSVNEQLTYTTASISPSKNRIVVVVTCDQKNGEGRVLSHMDYPGKEPPWVHLGTFKNCNGVLGVKEVL